MTVKKYGIIGCGMMGIEHINNLNLLEGAEVSCVFDPVDELAQIAANKAGGARIAASIDDLIQDASIDAIVIVSPNFLHVDQLEHILANRNIPVLCEKPLFTSLADYERIQAIERAASERVWVAMEYRYMPPIQALIEQAKQVTGEIAMLSIREHRFPFLEKVGDWNRFNENTGGTLVEKCCHFFDLMRLILRSEPVRVSASAGQITNHLSEIYDGRTPDIWDGGYVLIDFENGTRAMLELCMFADGSMWNEEISAVGPSGKIECRLPGPSRFWPETLGVPPHPEVTISPRHPKKPITEEIAINPDLLQAGDHHGSTFYQHQNFLNVVLGQAEPEVSVYDGRMAVMMGLAAQMAAEENRVVEFSEVL